MRRIAEVGLVLGLGWQRNSYCLVFSSPMTGGVTFNDVDPREKDKEM